MAYQANDLFQLQAELVDSKVEIATMKAIDRIVDQISGLRTEFHEHISWLRTELHELKFDMNKRFSAVESRLSAVETKLGMKNETRDEFRNRFIEYAFKAGWLLLAAIVSGVFLYLHHA